MNDPQQTTGRAGIARLLAGRGQGPSFRAVARQRIYLMRNPEPIRGSANWNDFTSAPRADADEMVTVSSLADVKDLVLLPDQRRLPLAHLSVRPGVRPEHYLIGLRRGMQIAAEAGASHVCWALDADCRETVGLLASRGWTTGVGSTTYHHSPGGAGWPGLPIRSDEI